MDNMELTLTIEEEPQATLNLGVAEGATDEASARTAEAYAKGTRNGVPVEEGDPAYHNNAKYYRDSAAAIAAGDVINDDAGAGDYNLTWSADKLTSQKADIDALEDGKADAIEVTDSTPASVMTFSDGGDGYPLSATFEIAPVQDLHGQANPYPGGAGKNFLDDVNGIKRGYYNDSGNYTAGNKYISYEVTLPAGTYTFSTDLTNCYITRYLIDNVQSLVQSATDDVSFTMASNGVFKVSMRNTSTTDISSETPHAMVASGSDTTYAPYANLCTITGWTGCNVSKAKKNLFDKTAITENYYINSSGELVSNVSWTVSDYIPVNAGGSVAYKGLTSVGSAPYSAFFDKNKRFISSFKQATGENSQSVPAGARYVRFSINYSANELNAFAVTTGTSFGDYEAYSATTYPISFPDGAGTVYGGTLTVNKDGTGKLIADLKEWTMPEFTEIINSSTAGSTGKFVRVNTVGSVNGESTPTVAIPICEAAKSVSYNARGQAWTTNAAGAGWTNIFVPSTATLAEINTALQGKQLITKISSPVEYDLTATEVGQILSLLGTNNLFCDTGDVLSVDYSADTKLYVDGKISEGMKLITLLLTANHEDGMKASKAYVSGDLLTVGNTLYKATTSIANGATLTAGTNVTETTIETELAALA